MIKLPDGAGCPINHEEKNSNLKDHNSHKTVFVEACTDKEDRLSREEAEERLFKGIDFRWLRGFVVVHD